MTWPRERKLSSFWPSPSYQEDLEVSTTKLLFALKRFREARGGLPASLAELAPEYINEIPIDPFDGKPLRYSRERRIFWSVGRDRIDSGGLPIEDRMRWNRDLAETTFAIDCATRD